MISSKGLSTNGFKKERWINLCDLYNFYLLYLFYSTERV